MFIAPFTRLTTLDLSDAARLGAREAARQAALLRVPSQPDPRLLAHDGEAPCRGRRPLEAAGCGKAG